MFTVERFSQIDASYRRTRLDRDSADLSTVVEELAIALRRRSLVPFLGAGVSRPAPSSLPLAPQLVSALHEVLWASIGGFASRLGPPRPGQSVAESILREGRLERILHALQLTHGPDPVRQFMQVLIGRPWNANHAALAAMTAEGLLSTCITLNFDLLIEDAAAAHDACSQTICPLSDASFEMRQIPSAPTLCILKPHGSLAPPSSGFAVFDLLAPTLAEIGNQPDIRNAEALERRLPIASSLLVAGYSDDDWDIFPLLKPMIRRLDHVYWVLFRPEPSFEHVDQWLRTHATRVTVLDGDPQLLWRRVCGRLKLRPRALLEAAMPDPDPSSHTSQFVASVEARAATAVAFALLLQDRGTFHEDLVTWLLAAPVIQTHPHLLATVHRSAAQSCHTRRKLDIALSQMDEVIRIRKSERNLPELADAMIWAGYEHFCLLKRPSRRWLLPVSAIRTHARGRHLMRDALRLTRHMPLKPRQKLRAMARFYRGDLFHTWGTYLLLPGRWSRWFARPLFRHAARWYERARRIDPITMRWEYYWLRTLEAELFSANASPSRAAAMARIEEIGASYQMLQNHVQRGNSLAYRALMDWADGAPAGEVSGLLYEAERIWSAEGGFVPSGLLRVITFRRVIGLRGLPATVLDLWRLARAVRSRRESPG